jgi:hypothetical protein
MIAKKLKEPTTEQKIEIWYCIFNEGLSYVIGEGLLQEFVEGTTLEPLVEAVSKAEKELKRALNKLGIGLGDFDNVSKMQEDLYDLKSSKAK